MSKFSCSAVGQVWNSSHCEPGLTELVILWLSAELLSVEISGKRHRAQIDAKV